MKTFKKGNFKSEYIKICPTTMWIRSNFKLPQTWVMKPGKSKLAAYRLKSTQKTAKEQGSGQQQQAAGGKRCSVWCAFLAGSEEIWRWFTATVAEGEPRHEVPCVRWKKPVAKPLTTNVFAPIRALGRRRLTEEQIPWTRFARTHVPKKTEQFTLDTWRKTPKNDRNPMSDRVRPRETTLRLYQQRLEQVA